MEKEVKRKLRELYEQIYFNKKLSQDEIYKYMEEEMELRSKNNVSPEEARDVLYIYSIIRDLDMPEGLDLILEETEIDGKPSIQLKIVKEEI